MNEFWNTRYDDLDYVYGTNPNECLKSFLKNTKAGSILLPCDGEGRNAVFCAEMGWDVVAFDFAETAVQKALGLAAFKNVRVDYSLSSWQDFDNIERFDVVASIFAHFTPGQRMEFHNKMMNFLKPNGTFLAEYFSKSQLGNKSGGPSSLDLLYTLDELRSDFSNHQIVELTELTVNLNEGAFHQGEAEVIRIIVKK